MEKLAPSRRMTVAEFIEWEDGTETRYELAEGQPVAMSPPKGAHADIVGNVSASLSSQLIRPWRPLTGGGSARGERDEEYRLPDLLVTCEPTPPSWFRQVRFVMEVLSPSTERIDRTEKLDFYQSLPTVEAILLVWQDKRRVQLHRRQGDLWLVMDHIAGTVRLPPLSVELALDEIYAGIELPPPVEA